MFISAIIFILGFAASILLITVSFFNSSVKSEYAFLSLMMGMLFAFPFAIISKVTSKIDKYTDEFIKEIEAELDKAMDIKDLLSIYKKISEEALDENRKLIILSRPQKIEKLLIEVTAKINILKKQTN
jgi:hypothetical protein